MELYEPSIYSMMQLSSHRMPLITSFAHNDAMHTRWCGHIEQVFSTAGLQLAASQIRSPTHVQAASQTPDRTALYLLLHLEREMDLLWSFLASVLGPVGPFSLETCTMWLWSFRELCFSILTLEGCHGVLKVCCLWPLQAWEHVSVSSFKLETYCPLSTGKFLTYKIAHGKLML